MDEHLTYDEIAERLNISRNAARVMVQRQGWPRTRGNDGRALVRVPTEALEARQDARERAQSVRTVREHETHVDPLIEALRAHLADKEAEVARLTEMHAAEIARLTAAHAAEVERLRADAAAQREEARIARLETDAARQDVRDLVDRLDRLHRARQAELAAARRRWWHRFTGNR